MKNAKNTQIKISPSTFLFLLFYLIFPEFPINKKTFPQSPYLPIQLFSHSKPIKSPYRPYNLNPTGQTHNYRPKFSFIYIMTNITIYKRISNYSQTYLALISTNYHRLPTASVHFLQITFDGVPYLNKLRLFTGVNACRSSHCDLISSICSPKISFLNRILYTELSRVFSPFSLLFPPVFFPFWFALRFWSGIVAKFVSQLLFARCGMKRS